MVSVQRQYQLTPGGQQITPKLRYRSNNHATGSSRVSAGWCEDILPWRPCVSCRICFDEDERPPNSVQSEVDPGFCCRLNNWRKTECVDIMNAQNRGLGCCKARTGCVCRKRVQGDPNCLDRECVDEQINVECERDIRQERDAAFRQRRLKWKPARSSQPFRLASNGLPSAPPITQPPPTKMIGRPFRGQTKSEFSSHPYCFCNSLRFNDSLTD